MSFPDKIQEIIFAHGRYILRIKDNSYKDKLPKDYKGIDTIEATNKIIELINSEIIRVDETGSTDILINSQDARNQLRKEQRLNLNEQKGERSKA